MPKLSFKYDISGLEKKLDVLEHSNVLDIGLRLLADRALEMIRQFTPGSGRMAGMWRKTEEKDESGRVKAITIDNTYEPEDVLKFMEEGTAPHVITPKSPDGFLVFYWDVLEKVVFAKEVHHPGTIPYNMVGLTKSVIELQLEAWVKIFENQFSAEVAKE